VATVIEPAPLGYRPSLDGVRALAVLMVAGVHTHPRLVPSGAIGVDVFFVLSGFLITTLLVTELDVHGHLSIGRFYIRRGLRLLPALFGLVAAPATRHRALREVLAAISYTRNLTWWAHVPGPLLGHTWSLALEEQFYLVWPIVLLVGVRSRRPATTLAAVFGTAAIVLAALRIGGFAGPAALFIGRPEALILGATMALIRRDQPQWWSADASSRPAEFATVAGAATLIGLAFITGADNLGGMGYTMAAMAAAALIYGLVVLDGRGIGQAFAWRPAVALGRVSYGFYLWHLPVLRWTDDRLIGRPAALRIAIGLTLAAAATTGSYLLIERPALRLKRRFAARSDSDPARWSRRSTAGIQ
jgi:peptidoglycan/LPS O-acetylase OafA/YrhL